MSEGTNRRQAANRSASVPRPRRGRLLARSLACAAALTVGVSATAYAGGGGVTPGGGGGGSSAGSSKYTKIWDGFSARDHKWAHKVSYCESHNNPRAVGGGGRYRGAFQFTRNAWNTSPKSPGGDPIRYAWKTQAAVAVLLKHRDGTRPWPVCG
jgi:hypothetical protein